MIMPSVRFVRRTVVAIAVTGLVATPALAAEVVGTPGDDSLVGTAEADTISGGAGADVLSGGAGADAVRGGAGSDVLHGDAGRDTLKGDRDDDQLYGGTEDDVLLGGAGADVLLGEAGDDLLRGDDAFSTEDGADVLRGAAGFDDLRPDDGDRAFGGPDADTFRVFDDEDQVVAHGGEGNDRYEADGEARLVFFGGPGDDQASTGTSFSGLALLAGGTGDDYLRGWASMDGGDGADILESQAAGVAVTLSGGDGDDEVYAAQPHQPTDSNVSCGPGVDLVRLDVADLLPADCEEVAYDIYGTSGPDTIEGTPYADFVVPMEGADTVRTFGGDDFVNGRGQDTGRDLYVFGAGDDSVRVRDGVVDVIRCGPGYDRVTVDALDVVADDCEFVGDFEF